MGTASVAALILAAGGSSRLGRPKQLEPWGDSTLLGHIVAMARLLPVGEIWVVLGAHSEEVEKMVDLSDCGVVENPEWSEGLASSLRVGLDAITRLSRAEAVVILMGDQPDVHPEVVERLVAEMRSSKRQAAVPRYRYTWGNPIVLARTLWPRVMSLDGDEGARRLLQAHPDWVSEVWFEHLPPRDVDTEEDVSQLRPR